MVSQRLVSARLGRLGCEVDVAASGREAIERAEEGCYDIIFMDCCMPEVDGLDATREIRRSGGWGAQVPIVAMTANDEPGDRERCLAAGMTDYLAKPASREDLRRVVERHVPSPTESSEPRGAARPAGLETARVDMEMLAQLQAMEAAGSPGLLADLTRDFNEDSRERLDQMERAVRSTDAELLESAAHSLEGCASLLGARALAERCRDLEALARSGRLREARGLLPGIAREHESIMSVLGAVIASAPGPPPFEREGPLQVSCS